jgi:hypothetical protein
MHNRKYAEPDFELEDLDLSPSLLTQLKCLENRLSKKFDTDNKRIRKKRENLQEKLEW